MRLCVIGIGCLLLSLCLPAVIQAESLDKFNYSGSLDCGDTSTFVKFTYNTKNKTIEDFELKDLCSYRLPKKFFNFGGPQPMGDAIVGRWTAADAFKPDRKGTITYRELSGYQVLGSFQGGAVKIDSTTIPGRFVKGFIGRPKTKLIECGSGQYYLPCSKWKAKVED